DAPHDALRAMGVDPARLPARAEWKAAMLQDARRCDQEKERFFLTWLADDEPVGHSSINKIVVGEEAFIHLHLWRTGLRRSGLGTQLFQLSVAYMFDRFGLKRILCEPYADNPAPNRVLTKLGFELVKRYRTVPGAINFDQDVHRYQFERTVASSSSDLA